MDFGSVAIKALFLLVILFLLSLAGALTFPVLSVISGGGAGLTGLLYFILILLLLSIIGNLLGRGIRSIKKPVEGLLLAFVGAFFMGGTLAIFAVLNIPLAARINLFWLGTSWYSPLLTLLFIGAPLMLVFIVVD